MDDSVVELGLGCVFLGGLVIQGVDELASQVVEGNDDLFEGALICEVLFSGQLDEGLDDGSEDGVVVE